MNHAPFIESEYEILKSNKKNKTVTEKFDAELNYKVTGKDGKVKEEKSIPFKSFVSNFSRILNYVFGDTPNTDTVTETDGTNPVASMWHFGVNEVALTSPTQSNYGIWIGNIKGDAGITLGTPNGDIGGDPAFEDYDLYNRILADGGSPDTDVVYGATNTYIDSGTVLRVTRRFTNNNANTIKVSEVGLVGNDSSVYAMICRDSITPSISLVSGDIVDISYRFTITSTSGYTKNFLRYLSSKFSAGAALENLVSTSGLSVAEEFTDDVSGLLLEPSTGTPGAYGILVGGDVTELPRTFSYSIDSYKLRQQLTNAQLTHGTTIELNTADVTQEDGYSKIGYYRDFENESDDPVYINEAGLVIKDSSSGANKYLISRIPITNTSSIPYVTVQPGEVFRLKYYLAFPIETYVDQGSETSQDLN